MTTREIPRRLIICAECGDYLGWEPADDVAESKAAGAEWARSYTICDRCLSYNEPRGELEGYGG